MSDTPIVLSTTPAEEVVAELYKRLEAFYAQVVSHIHKAWQ